MPAAAVIPAPRVYIYAAAVKKLVVGSERLARGQASWASTAWRRIFRQLVVNALYRVSAAAGKFTLNKSECSIQAYRLYGFAWNNRIGLWFYFVGFRNTK